jgi:hypothetical protein
VNWEKFQDHLDRLIRKYRLAIIGALLIHSIFFFLLVLFEVTKPEVLKDDSVNLEITPDIPEFIPTPELTDDATEENNSELKNIESNAGDANKSFDDYYREAQNMVDHGTSKESFKANDYNDLRYLAKDYTKENSVEINENPTKDQKKNQNDKSNPNSKNTYAGNTIITYNLGGRKATKLPIPAYQCLGSGEVNIEIYVNQKGNVTSVTILSANTSLNESCLTEAAKNAALSSRFTIDLKAPASQKGTIKYEFVKQ